MTNNSCYSIFGGRQKAGTKRATGKTDQHREGGQSERQRDVKLHASLPAFVLHVLQALSSLHRMCKRWIAADYNRLTFFLNTTALALGSKVTTDFNVVAELRS